MALLDFLFEGAPPPQVESFSSTSANLPDWYQAYLRGTVAKASAIAAEPYQGFTGPRVADLTPQQTAAYNAASTNQGIATPQFDAAGNLINQAAGTDSRAAAQPLITGALSYSPTGAADPYLTGASRTFPGAVDEYMNPYTERVVNRIEELGNRNLMENLLPNIQDQFIAAGQPGGTRAAEFSARALRDTQDSILGAQSGALSTGYGQAGQLFSADANRLGALAQTVGGLTSEEMKQYGSLAQLTGQLTSDTAGRQLTAADRMGTLGQEKQTAALRDAAALEAAGSAQQTQSQRNLDTAYQQFLEEREYPRTNVTFLNQALRGLQPPASTTTTSTAPASAVGASPLAQLAGAGLSLAALQKSGLFSKRGGHVKRSRAARGALSGGHG